MRMRILTTILLAALAAGAVFVVAPRFLGGPRPPEPDPPPEEYAAAPAPVDDGEPYRPLKYQLTTEQKIQFFQERVERDPQDYLSLTHLAEARLHKAREVGDLASYDRAEADLRRALEMQRDYPPAQAGLALVLCAQHRFAEGLRLAEQLSGQEAEEGSFLLIIGDARLELGDYAGAEKAYEDFRAKAPPEARSALLARLARLAELKGDPAEALRLMEQAAEEGRADVFSGEGPWFEFRLAELHFQAGRLAEAARHAEAALEGRPSYPAALALLGRVRAAEGKVDDAIELYRRAAVINADLPMLAELGDLYQLTGKDFLAKVNHDLVEKTARDRPAYDRELSLFYSNHERNLPQALELARRDLGGRQDVYAYDALAWALYQNGRDDEAGKAMAEALRLGTQDAVLFYHAGLIWARLGDRDKARGFLERALARNPHFSVTHAPRARQALAELTEQSAP